MDLGLGPNEGCGALVIGLDEGIDVFLELFDRGEGCAAQGLSFQDREPDLDLIEPGGPGRREVEAHGGMTLEPAIVLGLVGVEVIENDVNFFFVAVRINDAIHEVQELPAAPAFVMAGLNQPSGGF